VFSSHQPTRPGFDDGDLRISVRQLHMFLGESAAAAVGKHSQMNQSRRDAGLPAFSILDRGIAEDVVVLVLAGRHGQCLVAVLAMWRVPAVCNVRQMPSNACDLYC
jgi:hypothetical protein